MTGELRDRLRQATGPAHAQLEGKLKLLHEPLVRERFVWLLGRFHAFHEAWEPAMAAALPTHLVQWRLKLPLLERDLQYLGVDAGQLATLPACPRASSLGADEAQAAGALYVMEGSTLGGRIITRSLEQASWYPPSGLKYWDPYGGEVGRHWQQTLAYLESLPVAWSGDIIASAIATFELLQSWLLPQDIPDGNS